MPFKSEKLKEWINSLERGFYSDGRWMTRVQVGEEIFGFPVLIYSEDLQYFKDARNQYIAAVRDYKTGVIWQGATHADAVEKARDDFYGQSILRLLKDGQRSTVQK